MLLFESRVGLCVSRQNDAAIADYTSAIQLEPDNAKAYHARAVVRMAIADQKTEAQADLDKAAELYLKQGDRKQYDVVKGLR
ncbi:MAG: tetratricopeptide repeat protein [Acaryochloridaceae cyanobacterium RU_4_10]|nr:tetratricopeptide repeat protein [Acaryochloridaceae cyanobacterium RU_4_10]